MATSTFTIEVDSKAVQALLVDFRKALAEKLRALPRVTESDGSKWADVTELDALTAELDA